MPESNGPTTADYRDAMAQEILDKQALESISKRRKNNRKLAQSKGIILEHLDRMMKMSEEPVSGVIDWFKGQAAAFGAIMPEFEQMDLFVQREAPEVRMAYFHTGLMQGLRGEEAKAPDGLVGEPLQEFMAGWSEGNDRRKAANPTLADTLAAALKTADEGGVVDGTGGKRRSKKAVKVGLQAAKDFAADEGLMEPTAEEQTVQ